MGLQAEIKRLKDYYINIKKIGEEFSEDLNFIEQFIQDVTLSKDAKVLDIGTGFGIMAILLALHGFSVLTGEPEVEPERENWSGHHHEDHHEHIQYDWREVANEFSVEDKIKFQYLNAEELDFPKDYFDGIFMYDTLQHVKDKKTALKECIRVIKPGGKIYIIETNENGISFYQENYGFSIDLINPNVLIQDLNISCDIIKGKYVNGYILSKSFN